MCADTRQAMISRCSADASPAPCVRRSISDKPSAGRAEIYSGAGQAPDRSFALSSLNANVRASCTGPDVGVRSLLPCVPGAMRNCQRQQTLYARNGQMHACMQLAHRLACPHPSCADLKVQFDHQTAWACGHSTSLYDLIPSASGARAGDPIADCYALIAYDHHTVLVVADGVNWGEPAKRAARSAVLGAVAHLHKHLPELGAPGGWWSNAQRAHAAMQALLEHLHGAFTAASDLPCTLHTAL